MIRLLLPPPRATAWTATEDDLFCDVRSDSCENRIRVAAGGMAARTTERRIDRSCLSLISSLLIGRRRILIVRATPIPA